jgi:exopolyphosphatase/guanosine-5'-triphosphate,3'-diphosphate pyrophosphatase
MFFKRSKPDSSHFLVAVDLGSNSFHMLVSRVQDNHLQVIDRLREMVRLGAGLNNKNKLSEAAQQRAFECLQRFAQRLHDIPEENIRIVGTNTLRIATNAAGFMQQAKKILGHPIEIISGMEEARLIYLGVAHSLAEKGARRLVIDIGGGSTEVIIGESFQPIKMKSLRMGCVSMTRRFFPDGEVNHSSLRQASIAAGIELETIIAPYRKLGWEQIIGASGSIRAIQKVALEEGWSTGGITRNTLNMIQQAILDAKHINQLSLKGLGEDRRPVFIGGYVVLRAIFDAFDIEEMHVSDGAVREGVTYELLGRILHDDVQEHTIQQLIKRYSIDQEQAKHVEQTALRLYEQLGDKWKQPCDDYLYLLSWAAQIHEIGLAIAHDGYHKHGAYLASNSDLPGFSYQEQQFLAILIRTHRRKLSPDLYTALPQDQVRPAMLLSILLRLAVTSQRNRTHQDLPDFKLETRKSKLTITFPQGWLEQHALTAADLEQEITYLKDIDFSLEINQ